MEDDGLGRVMTGNSHLYSHQRIWSTEDTPHSDHIHATSESDDDRSPSAQAVLPRAWFTDQRQPHWQPVREAARHRERRQPGQVPGISEQPAGVEDMLGLARDLDEP
jgi:hypothetical protein